MAVRYIGSKARLAETILDIIGAPDVTDARFVDGFCGTGIVARTAALRGYRIVGNDTLLSATLHARASLLDRSHVSFSAIGTYEDAIAGLNVASEERGFIWRTYSPASAEHCEIERRYFTESNALKIDGIRSLIASWRNKSLIDDAAEALLVADLIEAANDIANIAGTYGCFLKKWTAQSAGNLTLRPRVLFPIENESTFRVGDIFTLETEPDDVVYLDPPYTKRQYASYYHIPETIAYHDEPVVEGVAGLRPWKKMASPFCYKTKALDAIVRCVDGLAARRIYLSYSSQGHVSLSDLLDRLPACGEVTVHELGEIGRYRPNRIAAQTGDSVEEYLIQVDKSGRR